MPGITPWPVGDLAPTWKISLSTDSNGIVDLTGLSTSALSLLIINTDIDDPVAATATGGGTFGIVQAKPAIVSYAPVTADVSTPGNYDLWVVVNYGAGQDQSFGPYSWQVTPKQ